MQQQVKIPLLMRQASIIYAVYRIFWLAWALKNSSDGGRVAIEVITFISSAVLALLLGGALW
jgi:hypothetical protein